MARYISLYSGSSGNCSVIEEGGRFIMIDIGKSARLTKKALDVLGLDLRGLEAIFISHEHSDHISGLNVFLKNVRVPVYSGADTLDYLTDNNIIPAHIDVQDLNFSTIETGSFMVHGFDTPHDSLGCLGFRVSTEKGRKMSLATDLGFVPPGVFENLRDVNLAVIESNYDPAMLKDGPYPYYLKRRIASDRGHLSNIQCSDAVIRLIEAGAENIQLCHLSNNNNTPSLALERIQKSARILGFSMPENVNIKVNSRHDITRPTSF